MEIDFWNEKDFIKRLKKGDSKAYTHMVEKYHQKLCAYAFNLTNDGEWAEDVVQTVYIKIWKKRENLKDNIDLINYLYKSIYHAFIDEYRKQRAVFSLEKVHLESLMTFVHESSDTQKDKLITLVKNEIENLPPKCKKVFLLSKQEGLTNIEIATYLNISKKSVEGHITKAFSELRERLGNQYATVLFLIYGRTSFNE